MEVSDQLANLGAVIAGGIERNIQQSQFQAALPVMQEAFKSAMQDFDSGRSGSGFLKIMGVAMENPNNPLIQNISQMAFTAGKAASDDYLSRRRITDQTTSGLTEDELEAFNEFGLTGGGDEADAGAVTSTVTRPANAASDSRTDAELKAGKYPPGTVSNQDGSVTLPDGRTIQAGQLADALPTQPDMSQPLAEVDGTYQLQTGEQIVETPFFQDVGIDISAVVGPEEYDVVIPKGTTESRTLGRKGVTATKSQQTEVVKKNTEEKNKFNSLIDKARSATSAIKSNAQLKRIFSKSGNDLKNIETDEEEDELTGKTKYKAFVTASDGTQSEEVLSKSEYDSLKVLTDEIPQYANEKNKNIKIIKARKEEAPAAQPAAGGGSVAERVRAQYGKKEGASQPASAPAAAPAKEMTLEERISAKTSAPTSTRKATPEQLEGVKAGQVRQQKTQQKSNLESEATKLERALYDMPRTAGGKKQLKRGLSAQDPDVKSALQRIAEINKQLEAL